MKIGIVTIYNTKPNYGNRLQNYAVYKTLLAMGLQPTTLCCETGNPSKKELVKFFFNRVTGCIFAKSKYYWTYDWGKRKKFNKFNQKYVPSCKVESFNGINNKFDYFVIGSDQVWNANWYDEWKKKAFLLTFAKPEQKVCFSPSFGISELPEEWKEYFRKSLKTFKNISVREEAGAKIVKELTGKTAEVLIDPTLMLSKEQWIEIETKPTKIEFNKKYIFTYFLGGKTEQQEAYIRKIADDNNLVIYNLLDYNQPKVFASDPSEFIYLLHNAEIIFTDSFHACVFSFIFQKPFQVFERNGNLSGMMSRIDTLLNKFSIQRKLYGNKENNLFECDYSMGHDILKEEQEKVIKFLKKSLNL